MLDFLYVEINPELNNCSFTNAISISFSKIFSDSIFPISRFSELIGSGIKGKIVCSLLEQIISILSCSTSCFNSGMNKLSISLIL